MRPVTEHQAKCEILSQAEQSYRDTGHAEKAVTLDEFIAATFNTSRYAIWSLSSRCLCYRRSSSPSRFGMDMLINRDLVRQRDMAW